MKLFQTQFNKGSLIEKISNTKFTNTNTELKRTEKGFTVATTANNQRLDFGSNVTIGTIFTFTGYYKTTVGGDGILVGDGAGSANYISINVDTRIRFRLNSVTYNLDNVGGGLLDGQWHHVIITRNRADVIAYVDNQLWDTVTVPATDSFQIRYICNPIDGNVGYTGDASFDDYVFTAQEREQAYTAFLNAHAPFTEIYPRLDSNDLKPTDLSNQVDSRVGIPEADVTERVTNGDFSQGTTGWDSIGIGWDLSTGQAVCTASINSIKQDNKLVEGKKYLVTFEVTEYTAGSVRAICGDLGVGTNRTAVGVYKEVIQAKDGINFYIDGAVLFTGTIDNVSCIEWDGEELVPDDTVGFVANDVSNWTPYLNNTVSQDNNAVKITFVDSAVGAAIQLKESTGIVFNDNSSDLLEFTFKAKVNTGNCYVSLYSGAAWNDVQLVSNTEYQTFTVRQTQAGSHLWIRTNGLSTGEQIWIEIISVKKITGLVFATNCIPSGSTLVDISGNGNDGTITNAVSTNKGINFKYDSSNADGGYADIPISGLSSYPFTVSGRFRANGDERIFSLSDESEVLVYYTLDISSGKIRLGVRNGGIFYTDSSVNDFDDNLLHTFSVLFISDTLKQLYVDNELVATVTDSVTWNTSVDKLSIGARLSSSPSKTGLELMVKLRVDSYSFNAQQIIDYHNSFIKPVLIADFENDAADGVVKTPFGWQKGTGSYKVGEIDIESGHCFLNSGFDNTSYWTISGASWTISGGKANYSAQGVHALDGVPQINIKAGHTYRFQFKISNVESGKKAKTTFANNSGGQLFEGVGYDEWDEGIYDFKLNAVANESTRIRVYAANSGNGGTFSIDDLQITEVPALSELDKGTKYLECTSVGYTALANKYAYGTIEFSLYKGADANDLHTSFVNNDYTTLAGNTYRISLINSERVVLGKDGDNLFFTAASYITNNTWYRIKVTRSKKGVFSVYIKGGAFGNDYTLVSTVGGTGTNPYTDNSFVNSKYFRLDFDIGDRIANIKWDNEIKQ